MVKLKDVIWKNILNIKKTIWNMEMFSLRTFINIKLLNLPLNLFKYGISTFYILIQNKLNSEITFSLILPSNLKLSPKTCS